MNALSTLSAPVAPVQYEDRAYQRKNTNEILGCLQRGEDPLYVLPTGGGKRKVFTDVTSTVTGLGWETCIFVPRKELLRQASRGLREAGIDHGIIAPGYDLTSHKVHVASIDTVFARRDSLDRWLRRINLGIPDEAHHAVAPNWADILLRLRLRFGNTATPSRLDGKGLGEGGMFKRMIRGPSIAELTRMGYLAEAHVYAPPIGIDVSQISKRGGDYVLRQIAQIADTPEMTNLARRWYGKICPGEPAIVFCTTVEHARNVARGFREAGWLARSVDGTTDDDERDDAIEGLGNGQTQVLTSCELVTEGLDIKAVAAAIHLRLTASTRLFLQMNGRTLRPHPDGGHSTILDLVGNHMRHGFYAAHRLWDLQSGLKGLERAVKGTWRCRKCHRVYEKPDESTVMHCDCGASQKTTGMAPAKVDQLQGINGVPADLLYRLKLQDALKHCHSLRDYEQLGKIKGYRRGWALMAWERANEMRRRFKRRA